MPWSLLLIFVASCVSELSDIDYLNSEVPGSAVSKLTEDNFDGFVKTGNAFVEFYAPWCGHCKHFARSWEEIGHAAQPKGIRVGKVDATVHKSIAGRYNVKGFPTLLFFRDGVAREYKGPRNKDAVLRFCDRVISDMVLPATAENHVSLREAESVTYALLCGGKDWKRAKATLERAAYDLADLPLQFIYIQDPVVSKEYLSSRDEASSQLVRFRLGDAPLVFPGSLTVEGSKDTPSEAVQKWLEEKRFPMVTEINDGYAYSALAKQGKFIVLGIYSGDKKEPLKKMLGRAARLQEEKFSFGILKLEEWDTFVSKRFGTGGLPRIIVLDGDNVHFEMKGPVDTSGRPEADGAFLKYLEDVVEGRVPSDAREMLSPIYNFWQRITRYGIVNAAQNHWFFVLVVFGFLGFIVWLFWMICKEEPDFPEVPKARKIDKAE